MAVREIAEEGPGRDAGGVGDEEEVDGFEGGEADDGAGVGVDLGGGWLVGAVGGMGEGKYVEEAEVEGPEDQEHADGEEHVGRLAESSPLDNRARFARRQARAEQQVDDDGEDERDEGGAAHGPGEAWNGGHG